MKLGDFFTSAPFARPVNPKPFRFTAVASGTILPGGAPNPHGRPVAATLEGAFVFLSGQETQGARSDARESLRERFVDAQTKLPLPIDDGDFELELIYQILWRVIHEWDAEAQTVGKRLFETAKLVRELVIPREANRIWMLYLDYAKDEHPEVLDDKGFRDAEERSPRMARAQAGR